MLRCAVLALAAMLVASPGAASIWAAVRFADLDGRTWDRGALEGRVVVLDFWATWCPPCLEELPRLRALQERHADDRLLILGIALDQTERRTLLRFLRRHDVSWPQVWDNRGFSGELARRFEVEAVPRTVLVDAAGRVVAVDLRGAVLEAAIRGLLGHERPAGGDSARRTD